MSQYAWALAQPIHHFARRSQPLCGLPSVSDAGQLASEAGVGGHAVSEKRCRYAAGGDETLRLT